MKYKILLVLIFISLKIIAQPYRYGSEAYYSRFRSNNDTAAWLSQLRQYEPKITGSLTSRFWRGDKTWQDFNAATLATLLNGFSLNNSAIVSTDNIVTAFGKTQQQISFREPNIATGLTTQYWRGDKSWQTLDKTAVGLNNVLNVVQEPDLGNPPGNGYFLQSSINHVRTWGNPLGNYMLKYFGQAAQGTIRESGIIDGLRGLDDIGTDNYSTFTAWSPTWTTGFQLQSFSPTGSGSTPQLFYKRRFSPGLNTWLSWKRLLTQDDAISTFQGTLTNVQTGFSILDYTLRRMGSVVTLTIRFTNGNFFSPTADYYLCDIQTGYVPTSTVYSAMSLEYVSNNESGFIKANTNGSIAVRVGKENQTWVANLSWIILTP